MTNDKLIQVLTSYRDELASRGVFPEQIVDYNLTGIEQGRAGSLAHLAWMCDEAVEHVHNGHKEKVFRWLGFMQGVLWSEGIFTLVDLRDHSRPDEG